MRLLFAGQVPKDSLFPESNEDAFEVAAPQGRIAISDGASESYDSQTWASLLVSKFIREPGINREWLNQALTDYLVQFDKASLSWSKQASFERGSFATLLGLESSPDQNSVKILSIGDSLVVLLEDGQLIESYPYSHFEEFQSRPKLICTKTAHNDFLFSDEFLSKNSRTWNLRSNKNPIILCMTDALGEWALRKELEGFPPWHLLNSISDLSQLESLVFSERQSKSMRIDDVTFIRVDPLGAKDDELSYP